MATSTPEVSLHFLDYWRVIRNRAAIIMTVLLLTSMTGYVVTVYVMQKMYQATAQVKVSKEKKDIGVYQNAESPYDSYFFNGEMAVIQSKWVLLPAIEKLKLNETWSARYFNNAPLTPEKALGILQRRVDITVQRNTEIMEIKVISDQPEEAAATANAIVQAYSDYRHNDQQAKIDRGMKSLDDEIKKQQDMVDAARNRIEEIRNKYQINITSNGGDDATVIDETEYQRKAGMLDDARAEALGAQVRYNQLIKLPINEFLEALIPLGLEDGTLSSLRAKKLQAESDLEQMRTSGLEANHPRIVSRTAEMAKFDEQIAAKAAGIRKAMEINIQVINSRVALLEKETQELAERVRSQKSGGVLQYNEARRDRDLQLATYQSLVTRRHQEEANQNIVNDPVQVIASATASDPNSPFRPNLAVNLSASVVVGLVIGIVLAFFIEYLDTSVKTMDDVEKLLDVPVLAVIPDGVGPLINEGPDSPHAEGYRILRAKIDLTPKSEAGNSLTIVSGGPGEGKTTTLFNLAYVCAQSGQSVLLVDADLRRPTVHSLLGIENEAGFSEALRGIGEAHQYIRATSIPNMHVITAGDMPASEMGAFSGLRLREILNDLKLRYDIVLLDAPPVLGISDGAVLAHEVDITLLVIQHRRYPRDISMRAKRAIEEVKGNLLGVVLNAVAVKSDEAYYYYSSYGSYYYNRNGEKKSRSGSMSPQRASLAKEESKPGGSEDF
jgi:polysaccharide biosynthesis transport protein